MLGESKNQFSLTRAALSTCGRAKSNILSVDQPGGDGISDAYRMDALPETLNRFASYGLNRWLCDQPTWGGSGHPELMMAKQSLIQIPSQTQFSWTPCGWTSALEFSLCSCNSHTQPNEGGEH